MTKLVPIHRWNAAVDKAGGDCIPWVHGYRNSRRLPADNPIFQPLRRLLRERGEWHGTVVQLQKDLGDTHYRTAFGRLLQQAIPFLASEFHWEKHTLPHGGVVQFFVRAGRTTCRTRGCQEPALARGRCRECFGFLQRTTPGWTDDVALDRVRPCCFKGCTNDRDEAFADEAEVPVCTYHKLLVQWRIMAEDCVGEKAAQNFPWDEDWLAARTLHELRNRAAEEHKPLFDRITGDTPLFKLFLRFFGRYEPFVR